MAEAEQIEPIDDAAAAAQAAEAAEAQAAAQEEEQEQQVQPDSNQDFIPKKVFLERLGQAGNKTRAAEEREAQARREANEYKALLDRLQKDGKSVDQQQAPAQQQPHATQDDVRAAAAVMLFQQDTNTVKNAGLAEFPEFISDLNVLNAVGATDDGFVFDLLAVDKANAHKILHWLAQNENIERAASLSGMDSRARIAELTRISDKMAAKPAPAPVAAAETPKPAAKISAAPKPRPALDGLSPADEGEEFNDKVDDATWSRNWDKKFRDRKRA